MKRLVALLLIMQLLLVQGVRAHVCVANLAGTDPHVHLSAIGAWLGIEVEQCECCRDDSHGHDHDGEPAPHDDSDAVTLPDGALYACDVSHGEAEVSHAAFYECISLDGLLWSVADASCLHTNAISLLPSAWDPCALLSAHLVI